MKAERLVNLPIQKLRRRVSSGHSIPGNIFSAFFSSFSYASSNSQSDHILTDERHVSGGRKQRYAGSKNADFKKSWYLRSNLRKQQLQKDDFDGMGGGFDGFQLLGLSDSVSVGNCSNNLQNQEILYDEKEERNNRFDDEGFGVLDSYDSNFQQNEYANRYEKNDDELRHPLVRETCRLIAMRSKWNLDLEGQLRNLLRSLKPIQVCAVLHSQVDERLALEFFYWADRQWRYRHDPMVYYAILQILSKTKLCQGVRRVLRLMFRRGIKCSPEAFGYLMNSYSRAGKIRHAMGVLNMMQRAGVPPNLSICNTSIHVLVMGNRLDKALRFLQKMQIVGIEPDVLTYNCLIKGYCDLGLAEDAMELIEGMPHRGCAPDKVSFYTVLGYFCREKNVSKIKSLLAKMVDYKLLPDMVTYNTLIHMLCKYGHPDEACEFLREAQEQAFGVDKVCYTALVHALCRERRVEKAKHIVNEMVEKGCTPDVVTYTTVLDGIARLGNIDEAKNMLQQMYKYGCKPNTVSYTVLLNGLCQIGRSSEAREMMNMSEEEWWTPNAITYSVLMCGFLKEGKLSEACDVVNEMIMRGFLPSPTEINSLLVPLCREGRMDEAKGFLEECLKKGCDINVINFTTVIHGYCQRNDLEAAVSLLDDMYLVNRRPDVFTYTTIIDAFGKSGKMEEATKVILKMLGRGILPTSVTYRMIIHRYCQHGRTEDLLKLLQKLLPKQAYRIAYNLVIEKLCRFGYQNDAYGLLNKVLRTASRIDAHTCHVLMESYLNRGSPLLAYKVACRMFRRNLAPNLNLCKKLSNRLALEGNMKAAGDLIMHFVERGLLSPSGLEMHLGCLMRWTGYIHTDLKPKKQLDDSFQLNEFGVPVEMAHETLLCIWIACCLYVLHLCMKHSLRERRHLLVNEFTRSRNALLQVTQVDGIDKQEILHGSMVDQQHSQM
ncbi:hypothetical protein Cgig2_008506 [Carnegiea gigantea]|uniref:Pentatricopeptide repeat-containing protein n=1 Tax=Carnegiea gigantea TaxID=171969 RepID=A0A9Q1GGH3_9CARY|nr:hypothetical protein Cgig2_008506 [Carnegiea gigantea]